MKYGLLEDGIIAEMKYLNLFEKDGKLYAKTPSGDKQVVSQANCKDWLYNERRILIDKRRNKRDD